MTDATTSPLADAIGDILARTTPTVEAVGRRQWRLHGRSGGELSARAAVEDGWLRLTTRLSRKRPPGRRRARRLWQLLLWNAALPNGAKYLLTAADRLAARVELPLDEEIDLPARVPEAVAALEVARACWRGKQAPQPHDRSGRRGQAHDAGDSADLESLCRQAGWEMSRRATGTVAVPLGGRAGQHRHALLAPQADGLSVSVQLTAAASLSACSREALGLFLLTACGLVRMVRAAAEEKEDGRVATRLEARLAAPPCPAAVHHALSACSVACGLCAEEAKALHDEALAGEYLAVRGWAA